MEPWSPGCRGQSSPAPAEDREPPAVFAGSGKEKMPEPVVATTSDRRSLSLDLAGSRLFRRRGGMVLMCGSMLAANRKQIFVKKIENIRRHFRPPLVDLFFVPVPIEPQRRIGQVFRKRQPVSPFTPQHGADLSPGMHFVDAPR